MCNRYRLTVDQAELADRYGARILEHGHLPEGDVFPKREAWVIRELNGLVIDRMAWGFPLVRAGRATKPVTNVRNLTSGFWRSALATPARRCLVPFTEFSEYGQQRGLDRKLRLHWFRVPSRRIASLAGIWRPTNDGAVFAFLTCEPNSLVAPIHPKAMPVVLHQEEEALWLGGSLDDVLTLAAPFPAQLMRVD
ncbi:MAG: DUF159 family protein [Sphingobium sp.]|nr:DUF159 family protein [Sphingobium sp.]